MAGDSPDNPASNSPGSGSGTPARGSDSDRVKAAMEQARARGKGAFAAFAMPPEDTFPGYQLLREIHRGGQGVVYQALHKGTKRKVAIKVMREGPFTSPKDRVRFEREVEILSTLNHPNIVAVHDSGTVNGLSFFAMDYISGQSLDTFVQESGRAVEDVLNLFVKVCDAVNAAHLRGVIHRDLKPGNIRVDANGEPHILDFGLAKTAIGDMSDHPTPQLMTVTGQFVGSLPWASPEQAEGTPSKVDVRTDVYSLGVILYQLLTGRFPYEVVGAMRDILENILRASPARPSTIRRQINDEVETIVLKCLSKDRDRRYQSAGELARDLKNYLGGQPIEAKRDSGLYVLRKTLGRYRTPVAAGAVALLALVVGGAAATVMYLKAEKETRAAVMARAIAEAARQDADRARALAEQSSRFLDGMFGLIDPDVARGSDTTVVQDMLREAGAVINDRLGGQPEVAAGVHDTIGVAYLRLGRYEQAGEHLDAALAWREKNLGAAHPDTARSLVHAAQLKCERGQPDDLSAARELASRARQSREAAAGPRHPDVAECVDIIGYAWKLQGEHARARENYELAMAMRSEALGPASPAVADSLTNLGELYFDQGDLPKAIEAMERALAIREAPPAPSPTGVATARQSLAAFLARRGTPADVARAEALFAQAVASLAAIVEPAHPFLCATRNKQGLFLLNAKQDAAAAERVLVENLTARRGRLGDRHPLVAVSRMNLSLALTRQTRFDEAEALLEEARKGLDNRDRYYPICIAKIVEMLAARSRNEAAHGLGEQAAASLVRARDMAMNGLVGNPEASSTYAWPAIDALVSALADAGQRDRAELLLASDAETTRAKLGADDPRAKAAAKRADDFRSTAGK